MTIAEFTQVLDAVSRLIGVVIWPALIFIPLFWLRHSIKKFFENVGELSIKGGGVEASLKKAQIEAAANLAAAESLPDKTGQNPPASTAAEDAAEVVTNELTRSMVKRASRSRILWVDDRPDNNRSIRKSFEALGIDVMSARSTEEAMVLLETKRFDLVISDMGRPPDTRAGYTLLSEMRGRSLDLPVLIYAAGGSLPQHRKEAREKGAAGSTNRATELFSMAMDVLRGA